MMQAEHPELILASASAARAAILGNAGIRFHQRPSSLDEACERETLALSASAADIALHLARKKALKVAREEQGAIVIGADQTLGFEGEILEKPKSADQARAQLLRLRGKAHELHSAAVLIFNGEEKAFYDSARLTMRDFTDEFLDCYLEMASQNVLNSVGAYHLEGLGIHLFSEIDGSYFTILGLPVTSLFSELRRLGVLTR
jgi:septum formation protein